MRGWVLLLLLAAPLAASQPLLVGVVPDLPGSGTGEEGIAVASATAFDLSGYALDDGEGVFRFPNGTLLAAGVPSWIVANASLWSTFDGPTPGLAGLLLQLGNGGDGVQLLDPVGQVVDAFAYGDGSAVGIEGGVETTSPGLVFTRLRNGTGWLDTDSADDWRTPRPHRIGESTLDEPTFNVTRLTLYSSPDSSFQVLTGLIASAQDRLHLHVYELRSAALVDALVAAKARSPGLDLQVLVEDNPVGMSAAERHETADALRRIEAVGGTAWLAGSARYDHHHLKVLVADDAVAVQSENWVPSGVPEDPTWGNRGWGAVVHDAAAADWFQRWMADDRAAWDTTAFELGSFDPGFVEPVRLPARSGAHDPVPPRVLEGTFRVTPVVAPDHTQDPADDPIAALVRSARDRLDVQQLDLDLWDDNRLGWSGDDALATAIVQAKGNGAEVRFQLAQPFSSDDLGNRDALAWLAERAIAGKELDRVGLATLHNKGIVADSRVVVGSINGNHHSRSENREVALLLEGPGIADFYGDLFAADWSPPKPARDWSVPGDDLRALPMTPLPTLLALTGVALALRGRR